MCQVQMARPRWLQLRRPSYLGLSAKYTNQLVQANGIFSLSGIKKASDIANSYPGA
jgi:hypothetical protein